MARSRALVVVSKTIRWRGTKYCLSECNDSRLAVSFIRRQPVNFVPQRYIKSFSGTGCGLKGQSYVRES